MTPSGLGKLFSANPARIGRFDGPPTSDAVPASLVDGTPGDLKADLIALLGKENVLHRAIDLVRYASDASPYRLVPQVDVLPRTTDDIVKLFRYCRETGRHATFRAAGTSLNGQSQSDDILIDVRRHWYGAKVEDDGRRVRYRPGMILGHINSLLERHGRRLGPDPASSHACTIGGVIANNAGGMRCTVQRDAYHTVSALRFVTPSGAVIDTSKPDAEKEFALAEPQLAEGLLELRRELLADPVLADRTRRKYAIRNTHGLRLCALLDGDTPLGIFRRLLVGSEGTLAFIAEAVLETIPAPRVTSVAWIPVPTIDEAIALVPGLVGKNRPEGSTLITEGVCFPPERLAEGAHDVQELLAKHGFIPGVAGHAAHGNLHFTLVADLGGAGGLSRYSAFMTELVDLVVRKHDGSLKAEHGTGRNMAPFVASEWGEKATAMMWRIKQLADPHGILAPDVILTRNPSLHLENLKSFPQIEGVTGSSQCIECGFCEPVCPSRNVTMTPRQRIALRREMTRQKSDSAMLAQLQREDQYDGVEACAGDGMCSIPCPIGINTGALIKEFRARENSPAAEWVALRLAQHWKAVEPLARLSLWGAHAFSSVFGVKPLTALAAAARSVVSPDLMPAVPGPMPRAASGLPETDRNRAAAVYFCACINRMFARDPARPAAPSLAETFVSLSRRAGKPLWISPDVAGLCCSTPWRSKGYRQGHKDMGEAVAEARSRWSDRGALPIVVGAASCTLGLREDVVTQLEGERKEQYESLKIIESIAWCRDLLPNLAISRTLRRVAVHPTCSTTDLGLAGALKQIAGC